MPPWEIWRTAGERELIQQADKAGLARPEGYEIPSLKLRQQDERQTLLDAWEVVSKANLVESSQKR